MFGKTSFALALALFVIFALGGCATSGRSLTAEEKEAKIQRLIADKDFVGIFKSAMEISEKKNSMGADVSVIVKRYFEANGNDRESVIKTLNNGFFNVIKGSDYNPNKKRLGPPYDEQIIGSRKNTFLHLYRYITYKTYVYMKDGRVDRVIAIIGSDGL